MSNRPATPNNALHPTCAALVVSVLSGVADAAWWVSLGSLAVYASLRPEDRPKDFPFATNREHEVPNHRISCTGCRCSRDFGSRLGVIRTGSLVLLRRFYRRFFYSPICSSRFVRRRPLPYRAQPRLCSLGLSGRCRFTSSGTRCLWLTALPASAATRTNSAMSPTPMRQKDSPFGAHPAPVTDPAPAFAPAGSAPVTRSACVTRRSNPFSALEKKKRTTKASRLPNGL